MPHARAFVAAAAALLALGGCSTNNNATDPVTGVNGGSSASTATVQLINATGAALDLATNGTVDAGNASVGFGGASACTSVSPTTPGLTVRQAGTTAAFANFTPTAFQAGNRYTVIAYRDAAGATQFATVGGGFTPASGQAGLRVFNAAPGAGSFDAYVTAPGAALGAPSATGVALGSASNFFNVANGSSQVRFANTGTGTVSLDAGTGTFVAGQSSTVVIAPNAVGGTGLTTFFVPGC